MLYISDISRFKEDVYGVTDTKDNVTEYVKYEDIVASGLDVKGVVGNKVFSVTPYSEEDIVYLGDWIAPPLHNMMGRIYKFKNSMHWNDQKITYMYSLFYYHEGVFEHSLCKLRLTEDMFKKYVTFYENRTNSKFSGVYKVDKKGFISEIQPRMEEIIETYFENNVLVEVELDIVDNSKEMLAEVLKLKEPCNILKLTTLSADLLGDKLIAPVVKTGYVGARYFSYTDITAPPSRCVYSSKLNAELISGYFSRAHLVYDFWTDMLDYKKKHKVPGSLSIDSVLGVRINKESIQGLYSESYSLESFIRGSREYSDNDVVEMLKAVFPNKMNYVCDIVKTLTENEKNYCIYFSLDGFYLVRGSIIDLVKMGDSYKLNSLRAKTRLISPHMVLTEITPEKATVKLSAKYNTTLFDFTSLLDDVGSRKHLSIDITDILDMSNIYFKLPDGFEEVDFHSNKYSVKNFQDSTLEIVADNKDAYKKWVNQRFIHSFTHIKVSQSLYDTHAYKFFTSSKPFEYNPYVQHLFDISINVDKDLSDSMKKRIVTSAKKLAVKLIKIEYGRYSNFVTLPKGTQNSLKAHNLVGTNCDKLYVLNSEDFFRFKPVLASLNRIYGLLEVITNLDNFHISIPSFMLDVAKVYIKYLTIISEQFAKLPKSEISYFNADSKFYTLKYTEDVDSLDNVDPSKWKIIEQQ